MAELQLNQVTNGSNSIETTYDTVADVIKYTGVSTTKTLATTDGNASVITAPAFAIPEPFITGIKNPLLKNKAAVEHVLVWNFSSGTTEWSSSGSGTTWALSGNYIQSSGGGGASDFTNYYKYSSYEYCFNEPQPEMLNFIPTVNASLAGQGIGVGIKSIDDVTDLIARIDLSATATRGQVMIYKVISGVPTLVIDSGTNYLAFTTNVDNLSLKLRRRSDGFLEAKALNNTTGLSVEVTSAATITISSRSNYIALWHFGGTQKTPTVSLANKNKAYNNGILIGDSITAGYGPGLISDSQSSLYLCAGSGQTSTNLKNSLDALVNSGATYAIIMIGMNDAGASVNTATYLANLAIIINGLVEVGITPYLCYVTPSTDATRNGFIQGYNSGILSTYNGIWTIIDTYSPLSVDGTLTGALDPSWDSGDGIHPNATGNLILDQTVESITISKLVYQAPAKNGINLFQKTYYGTQDYSASSFIANRFISNYSATSSGAKSLLLMHTIMIDAQNLSTGTVTNVRPLIINTVINSGGGSIVNIQGITVNDQTVGSGVNYGVRSLISAGTNKLNFYASGTAQNCFIGQTGIGSSSINASLDINRAESNTAWGTSLAPGFRIRVNTYTDTSSSGTVATLSAVNAILAPAVAASSTTTYSGRFATFYVEALTAGANVTLSSPRSIYATGVSEFTTQVITPSVGSTGALNIIAGVSTRVAFTSTGLQTYTTDALSSGTAASVTITQALHTGGTQQILLVTGNALTSQITGVEVTDINLNLSAVMKIASGTVSNQRAIRAQGRTYTPQSGSLTLTKASTLSVSSPIAGASTTITTNAAIECDGNLLLSTIGNRIFIPEGSGGFMGQVTLVSGTKAITISGLTSSHRAFPGFVAQGGTSTAVYQYAMVCTANTLTITAVTVAGITVATDTSVINYIIFQPAP